MLTMSAAAAAAFTGRRTNPSPEPIRAAFYGRKNRTDTDALRLLARQYLICEQAFRGRVVMTRCFYDLPSPVDTATLRAAGLPKKDGGWNDLAASLTTPDPGFDLIVCDQMERLSRDRCVAFARERLAAHHCVPIAYATEPWDPALEMLTAARGLTALLRRSVLGARHFVLGREV
ncbi:hypothetical protein [Amycolatopsis sp. NPDC059021]|uniref:hypothetical protein n=1 Tax=Amycolatopsis sp. NPDC059021 TaxID=3346704 RepID=UPI00367287E3